MFKVDLSSLFGKEMDRKEFLRSVGIAILGIAGLGAIFKGLESLTGERARTQSRDSGYGSASYGGK